MGVEGCYFVLRILGRSLEYIFWVYRFDLGSGFCDRNVLIGSGFLGYYVVGFF